MERERVSRLTRRLAERLDRRRLAGISAAAGLAALFGSSQNSEAKKKKKKKKKPASCVSQATSTTCAGKCGSTQDNCGLAVDCGRCCTAEPKSTTCAGKCGNVQNSCGQTVDCGACCTPESVTTTCAGKCGTVINNCGQAVPCGVCGYTMDREWGGTGTADGKFDTAPSIAVDGAGFVYVTDNANERVQKFTSDGTFVEKWMKAGFDEDDAINFPFKCTIRGNEFYMTSQFNNKIQVFNLDGQFQRVLGGRASAEPGLFDSPRGLDTMPNGDLVVADQDNNRIQIVSPTGAFVRKWGTGPSSAQGSFDDPIDVAADAVGNVFVVDYGNNRIQKFSGTGDFIKTWGGLGSEDSNLNQPSAVAVDGSGNVFVIDEGSHVIKKFTNNGDFLTKFEYNSLSGRDLVIDAQDRVWFVGNDYVRRFVPPTAREHQSTPAAAERAEKAGRDKKPRGAKHRAQRRRQKDHASR